MKFSGKFDQNSLVHVTKLGKTHSLTLRAKVTFITKFKSQCPKKQKPIPQKNLSRGSLGIGSLSNWAQEKNYFLTDFKIAEYCCENGPMIA